MMIFKLLSTFEEYLIAASYGGFTEMSLTTRQPLCPRSYETITSAGGARGDDIKPY